MQKYSQLTPSQFIIIAETPTNVGTHTIKVNISNLMTEMANTCQTIACSMGTRIALSCLERIAQRACVLNDAELLKELQTLGLVVESA